MIDAREYGPKSTLVAAILCCLALAGCAVGFGSEECRADSHPIGERDGFLGAQPQLELYNERCRSSGAQPDAARYEEGWRAGFYRRPMLSW